MFTTEESFQELPSSIVTLSHLKILKVAHNRLRSLPGNVGSLKSLEILDLTGNELTERSLEKDFFQLGLFMNERPLFNEEFY